MPDCEVPVPLLLLPVSLAHWFHSARCCVGSEPPVCNSGSVILPPPPAPEDRTRPAAVRLLWDLPSLTDSKSGAQGQEACSTHLVPAKAEGEWSTWPILSVGQQSHFLLYLSVAPPQHVRREQERLIERYRRWKWFPSEVSAREIHSAFQEN